MTPAPNFLVVGAPKAGTTSLYHYLRQHPDVYMSPIKEPNFFVSELRPEHVSERWRRLIERNAAAFDAYLEQPHGGARRPPGIVMEWDRYLALFRYSRDGQAIGEASVACLWSRTAARAIAERLPEARVIMILRNPADRTFSQHLQAVAEDRAGTPFGARIRRLATNAAGSEPVGLLDVGLYASQIQRFLDRFPPHRVGIHLYEEFSAEPAKTVRDIFRFLRVRDDVPLDCSERYMQAKIPRFPFLERRVFPALAKAAGGTPAILRHSVHCFRFVPRKRLAMALEDRRFLIDFYADDVRRLSRIICRDLSHWLQMPGARSGPRRSPAAMWT